MTNRKTILAAGASALLLSSLALTGCSTIGSLNDSMQDKVDRFTERTVDTSEQAIKDDLVPTWAPTGATNVKVMQRDSGPERLISMDYTGKLTSQACKPIKNPGHPSEQELAAAFASDPRTKAFNPKDMSTTRTLEADWWPADTENKATELCGRFWVSADAGKLYAFSPDTTSMVEAVQREREQNK